MSKIEEKFEEVLTHVREGKSLVQACALVEGMGRTKFYELLKEEQEEGNEENKLANNYARACEIRADLIFEEILHIADNTLEGVTTKIDKDGNVSLEKGDMTNHRRLQIDARKWTLSKMQPKKYGDKVDLDLTSGGDKVSITLDLGFDDEEEEEQNGKAKGKSKKKK